MDIDDIIMADWYADASLVVRADMKGHTVSVLTMGKLSIQRNLMKHNINTKSSTEV